MVEYDRTKNIIRIFRNKLLKERQAKVVEREKGILHIKETSHGSTKSSNIKQYALPLVPELGLRPLSSQATLQVPAQKNVFSITDRNPLQAKQLTEETLPWPIVLASSH